MTRKTRSRRISAHHTTLDYATAQTGWLMQWHYSQRGRNQWGEFILSGFRSIIKRDGEPGLYIDRPYFCYAGVHRYRRLSRRLAARIMLCAARGYVHDHIFRAKERARFALWRAQQYAAAKIYQFKHRKDQRALFDSLGI